MFNEKDKDGALIYLPAVAVGVRVTRNVSALLAHLIRHNAGDYSLSLEDFRKDGATLVISSRIKLFPNWLDENYGEDLEDDTDDEEEEETEAGYKKWPNMKDLAIRQEKERNGVAKYEEDWDDYPDEDEEDMAF